MPSTTQGHKQSSKHLDFDYKYFDSLHSKRLRLYRIITTNLYLSLVFLRSIHSWVVFDVFFIILINPNNLPPKNIHLFRKKYDLHHSLTFFVFQGDNLTSDYHL